MTDPDDGLAEVLRWALSETAGAVTPGPDGLNAIRARIGGRPPRPWLLSVLAHWAEQARYWTWRGHWARPGLARPATAVRAPARGTRGAHRRHSPEWGIGGLRLTAVLGTVAVIAGLSFGLQPVRQAIIQASASMLNGVSGAKPGGTGTDGNGAQAAGGGLPTGGALPGQGGSAGAGARQGGNGSAGQPGASCVSPGATLAPTAAASGTAPTAQASDMPSVAATAARVPVACPQDTPTVDQASGSTSSAAGAVAAAPSDSGTFTAPTDSQTYYTPSYPSYPSYPSSPSYPSHTATPHPSWNPPTRRSPTPTPTPTVAATSPAPTPTDSDGSTPPVYPTSPPYESDPPSTGSPPPPIDPSTGP